MLKLVNIKKDYVIKDLPTVHALKGISLNFRRNEFVAILGASGCGKTTLLNITGGLDRYTDGDLIIEGKSTKDYNDRDWDTYRNHSIGFVFQSYNLISHQSVLANVELALTISGVSKKERKERAREALKIVGLEGMDRKKPNQLSGGQMQRVAIARALVNNPEILLADEPTGALDSETSLQIMDLLKDVAKDRLVIMVTHNPDLAYQYANRIVKMSDGVILDDSNPYDGEKEEERIKAHEQNEVNKGSKAKTSMSFVTATGLSFANLFSKLRRTILVSIAGSIGIVGVSMVLAVSNGITSFIASMQDDMLSSYPLSITEESADYSSLMGGLDNFSDKELFQFDPTTQVGLDSMINYLMTAYSGLTSIKTNTIDENLLAYLEGVPEEAVSSINYSYGLDVTNNIFTSFKKDYLPTPETDVISLNGLTQRYIAELKTVDGFSEYASYVDLFTDFMKQLPGTKDYVLSQYDLLGNSKFAQEEDEIMLVVQENSTLTDLVLAQMGIYDHDEFLNIAKKAIYLSDEEDTRTIDELNEAYPYRKCFNYDELIGREFYYFPHDTLYTYGDITTDTYNEITTVLDSSDGNEMIILTLTEKNPNLITGVYVKKVPFTYSICYGMRQSGQPSSITNPMDLLKGTWAGICGEDTFMFEINNPSDTSLPVFYSSKGITPVVYSMNNQVTNRHDDISGYKYEGVVSNSDWLEHPENYGGMKMKISGILRPKEETNFGCLERGVYYTKAFAKRYMDDAFESRILNDNVTGFLDLLGNKELENSQGGFKAYVTFPYLDYTNDEHPLVEREDGYASALNGDLSNSFANLFSSLTGVDYFEQDQIYLRSLSGVKVITSEDEFGNETLSFKQIPESISIFPNSFEDKDEITDYLDKWNSKEDVTLKKENLEKWGITVSDDVVLHADERDELTYSDTIEIIIAVINTLIKSITIALIAFTSLSLVVSCFMIAVITYISVMERVKEIGVIRSLGGRKKDVSRLFTAETLIIGLASGVIGVGLTYVLSFILNIIVAPLGVKNLAALPILVGLGMVMLSIVLNVISGFIPSKRASRQDPVIALRSE